MQSKKWSFVETVTNTFVGITLAITITQIWSFIDPTLTISLTQNVALTTTITIFTMIRGYIVRRAFNKADKPGKIGYEPAKYDDIH